MLKSCVRAAYVDKFSQFCTMRPKASSITVVIPVRNRAEVIVRTLDSIAAQTLLPAHLVVVDNGSADATAAVVSAWLEARPQVNGLLLSEPKPGAAHARNCGLDAVNTEITLFFDSDDEMLPTHIADMQAAFDANPDADVVGRDVLGPQRMQPFYAQDAAWHNLMHGSMATQRYAARTEVFRRVGGWCDEVRVWDDIELGARIIASGALLMRIDAPPAVVIHASPESVSGMSYASRAEEYELALTRIAGHVSAEWVNLKRAILAADMAREHSPAGPALLKNVLKTTQRPFVMRMVYAYRRIGLRGAARVFRAFV